MAGLCIPILLLVLWLADAGSASSDDAVQSAAFAAMLVAFSAVIADTWLASRITQLTARLNVNGVLVRAGGYSRLIPWNDVTGFWVVGTESVAPVLCLAVRDPTQLQPTSIAWRIKVHANRRLFGTPVAIPLVGTGLDELGTVDVMRAYLRAADTRSEPPMPGQRSAGPVHRRLWLMAGVAAPVAALTGAVWGGLATFFFAVRPGGSDRVLVGVAVVAGAIAATLALVSIGSQVYRVLVPLAGASWPRREPVLRLGPDGLEQVVRGRMRQAAWPMVRRVYPVSYHGTRFVCVATVEPFMLVPRVRGWQARAAAHVRRFGAPVAVPVVGAGLTEADLLAAARHYSRGQLLVDDG